MRYLLPLTLLYFVTGCSKPQPVGGFRAISEVAASLSQNSLDESGYTIVYEEGASAAASGTLSYRIGERTLEYATVRASVFSRIDAEIQRRGFHIIHGSAFGGTARCWEFYGLGIAGALRIDFTEKTDGEFATIVYIAVQKDAS